MFSILIIAVGKTKTEAVKEIYNEYLKRIRPFAKVEIIEIESEPSFSPGDHDRVQKKEQEKIKLILEKREGAVTILSEDGKEYTSETFSRHLVKEQKKHIFVIGGAFGFSKDFKEEHERMSLSQFTFPHEIARTLLIEQIYRAITIEQKSDYHK